MAAGIDPERTNVYLQSQIGAPTVELASLLDRHMTLSALMRVPTLKDKLKEGQTEVNATVALARYPILMAADIMIANATHVPVGADQLPHIEVTRNLSDKFNNAYGKGQSVLVKPDHMIVEGVKIAGLDGSPKMSKSAENPNNALFLKDSPSVAARKIKRAKTGNPGEESTALDSLALIGSRLTNDPDEKAALELLKAEHADGKAVMGQFKGLLTDITGRFLGDFQERFDSISDREVKAALRRGGEQAGETAHEVMGRVYRALGLVSADFLRED
jgi:tryptophanyl-tRNA synthetase